MKGKSIGLKEALRLTLDGVTPLPVETVPVADCVDRVPASDLYALVDSPSMDSSRKDGYAVSSQDVAGATAGHPVRLQIVGSMAAGGDKDIHIQSETAVRVLTGSRIPTGADAVVAEEFVEQRLGDALVEHPVEIGKNILRRGSDVALGRCIVRAGEQISPLMGGLLAAAGHHMISVHRNPTVGIIGTGDEIVEPGNPLAEGNVYASNIITLAGWCHRYKMKTLLTVVRDDRDAIAGALKMSSEQTDAVITSGGAWTGDRDMLAEVLEQLGWEKVFHRIRMGPGKAVGFGRLNEKPVFVLAGGPPSNLVGFLQIALPGLLALAGHGNRGLPVMKARLASGITESERDWTDFFFGKLDFIDGMPTFYPMGKRSRLSLIAKATALASIPEGQDHVLEGSLIPVQLLRQAVIA